jgi:putative ATP-binding cassette transporter
LARALLIRPDWLFLDEATASLDPETELEVLTVLRARLPNTTLVSIAHRENVQAMHQARVVFERSEQGPGTLLTTP